MTETETEAESGSDQPTALLIIPGGGGKSEKALSKFLQMIQEYRYGLEVESITNVRHVVSVLKEHKALHSVDLIQGQPVSVNSTVPILTANGTLPLFIVQPKRIAQDQMEQCKDVERVHVCARESAFGHNDTCLARTVARGLTLADRSSTGSGEDDQEPLRERLAKLDTLPSLPTVVGRLMQLIEDPKSTMSELEVLLDSDPAITLKVR